MLLEILELMSTRLAKKDVYSIEDLTGLSKKCDVFICKTQILYLNNISNPRYYFISMFTCIGIFFFIQNIL